MLSIEAKSKIDREIKERHSNWEKSSLDELHLDLERTNKDITKNETSFADMEGRDTMGLNEDEKRILNINKAHICLNVIDGLLNRISIMSYIGRKSKP